MSKALEACQKVVAEKQFTKVDGVLLDLFTASAVVQVHNALNPTNQAKFAALPLPKMAKLAFSLLA